MRAGTSGDYPPFSDWTEERPRGFSIALVEAFAAAYRLEPSWLKRSAADRLLVRPGGCVEV